jgi:mRNA interferase MazF
MMMQQGEIWEIYFDPTKGSEQGGRRPALVLSGNVLNTYSPVVIFCPLTTKVKGYKGNVVLKPTAKNGLQAPSEVLVFHIRSVAKERLKKRIGVVEPSELQELISGLNDILKY